MGRIIYDEDDTKYCHVTYYTYDCVLCFGMRRGVSKELLNEDYKKMSNENILRYYYSLNDEIERQEKQSGPQFGIGIGSFGHGVGGGASVGMGGSGYTADDLRARRIDVRLELKRRGLNP
jgi:hypothetical protein